MKVGDKLYCYNSESDTSINVGKTYIIFELQNDAVEFSISITDDEGYEDWFSIDKWSSWYYGNYFYTLNELRKNKLEKINKRKLKLKKLNGSNL